MINEKTAKELAKTMREINANAKKNKKITRPVVVNKYSKGEWLIDKYGETINNGNSRICSFSKQGSTVSEQNRYDARLIVQAPKMHQMCEMFFDMLKGKHEDSIAFSILDKILNDINPTK